MRLVDWGRRLVRRLADGEIPLITDEAWLPDPVDDIWPQMPYNVDSRTRRTTVDN